MKKNAKTHFADTFCGDVIQQQPDSLKLADMFYRDRTILTGKPCPKWCALPSSTIAAFLAGSSEKEAVLQMLKQPQVFDLTTALLWSRNKMVYRFDITFADTLAEQPFDGKIPCESLDYLPYPCVFIEQDMIFCDRKAKGFFAWIDWGTKEDTRILVLIFLLKNGRSLHVAIPLSGGTIKASVAEKEKNSMDLNWGKFTLADVLKSAMVESFAVCINLLLYLCSEKPDMPDDTELRTRRSRNSIGIPKRPAVWDVGIRIGSALKKVAESATKSTVDKENEFEENMTAKTSPRAHTRRAHWHSFWKGKRGSADRRLILRWLPPTVVNFDEKGLPTVVSSVKGSDSAEG